MTKERFKRYVVDTISLLKDLAIKAKLELDNPKEWRKNYAQGLVMGYYSIITLLKNEAFAFCIDQKALGLAAINPDVDLLNLGRNSHLDAGVDNWAIDLMHEEKIKGYLIDSITLLKEQAIEVKKAADNPKEGCEEYNKGELMAYFSLFTLLKHQASVCNINEEDLGIDGIFPSKFSS